VTIARKRAPLRPRRPITAEEPLLGYHDNAVSTVVELVAEEARPPREGAGRQDGVLALKRRGELVLDILCTHRLPGNLRVAITSVLEQTLDNLELLASMMRPVTTRGTSYVRWRLERSGSRFVRTSEIRDKP
jgi:hypothetical protein